MNISKFTSKIAIHDFDKIANSCGDRIRQARKEKGLSIADLAKILNRDYSFVVKYETNKRTPKDDLLMEIGDVLGVSPLYLKYGQYYEEVDDFGGLAIHYYSNKKYTKKSIEENKKNLHELQKNINIISSPSEGDLDYIKIMKDISRYIADIKFRNSPKGKKLYKNIDSITKKK